MKKVFIISFCIILFVQAIFCDQLVSLNTSSIACNNSNNSIQSSCKQEILEGFLAGTLIKTATGYIPIEQLKVGDFVSGVHDLQEVFNIKQIEIDQIIQLNIDGMLIFVAQNQQFFLQDQALKKACDLLAGDCLSNGNFVKDIQFINEPSVFYCLSTEKQSFFVYPNIDVHNFNIAMVGAGGVSVLIGSIELFNPITLIGGIIGLSWYALQYFQSNVCHYEMEEKEYNLSEEELSFVSDVVMQETRRYYDSKKYELSKIYQDLTALKNNLLLFIKPNYLNSLYFSIGLLSEYQYNFIESRAADISYDMRLNVIDRAKLIKMHEAELEKLQQDICDISLLLGLHCNEMIERKDQAEQQLDEIEITVNKSIEKWNSYACIMRDDIALDDYYNHFLWKELIENLELKIKEFDFIINYYDVCKTHFFVNKITNISIILEEQLKSNKSILDYIRNTKNIICSNMQHHEYFLQSRGLLTQYLINQNKMAARKYLASKDVATIAHFKKKKNAASHEVNKIFNNDRDKKSGGGDPDKDPEDPLPKHNQSIMKHIFRDKKGHMLDTPENRELLRNLVKNSENYLGQDVYLNNWYGKILDNGKQLWAWVRNNTIRDAGLNDIPRAFNNRAGLCYGPKS